MATPDLSADASTETQPAELVEVGVYRTFADGSHHGLVVLAMGRPYWLAPLGEAFQLLVEAPVASQAREQLARFDRESLGWPPPAFMPRPALPRADFLTPLLWAWAAVLLFLAQARWPEIASRGVLDAVAVFDGGEVWRPFTALFLHADFAHLASNLLAGFLVFAAVVSTLGRVRGWLGLAAAAMLGNLGVAWLHHPSAYQSLGASTAVFAGVGLLTGHAVRGVAAHVHRLAWRPFFVPAATGLIMLGLYGADAVASHVDVGAHTAGFFAGVMVGLSFRPRITTTPMKRSEKDPRESGSVSRD